MKEFPELTKVPRPPTSAKGKFLMGCFVLAIVYLGFSFAFQALADPPSSPYLPGETLNPTCSPTSTDCTVLPPLFSTTTLSQGGILFMNDNSGTVTAATSSLYWNASTSEFEVSGGNQYGLPTQSATTSLLLLGPNQIAGGNVSGTFIGGNTTSVYHGDWMDFQINSSSVFQVDGSGSIEIATGTQANGNSLLTIATSSVIFNVLNSGQVGIGVVNPTSLLQVAGAVSFGSTTVAGNATTTNLSITAITNALDLGSGTGAVTAYGGSNCAAGTAATSVSATGTVICATVSTLTTSTAGIANFLDMWTGASSLGASWVQQTANSLIVASGTGWLPLSSTSTSILQLGSSSIANGSASGTFFGINASSVFAGDFVNFEAGSSSKFDVSATGTLSIAGNLTVAGITSSSQARLASSTITNLTFGNGTSTGNIQAATGIFTTKASSSAITFTNATGSGILTIFKLDISSSSLNASGSKISATSTLIVCAISNCNIGGNASTTNTVAYFASTDGTQTGNSIVARGYISAGANDVGEYIPVVGDDSDYSQGDVVSAVDTSSVAFAKSAGAYDPDLAGVITTTAGLVAGGGDTSAGTTIISLAGRVPVNVTTENGAIHVGDYITSSNMPGVGMLATQPGRVIGMALADDLGNPDDPNATSQVMMLVNPGWSLGSLTDPADIASSSWALVGTAASGQVVLDQFTAYVQAALAKLGLALENGVATLQQVVADTITTNELCVQGTCINGNQLSNLLNNSSPQGSQAPTSAPAASPAPAPVSPPSAPTSTSDSTSTDSTSTDSNSTSTSTPDVSGSSTDISAPVNDTTTPIVVTTTDDTSSASASSTSGGQ